MSRNATASWSGYSHQGKVGLLIALRKIRTLGGQGLADFHIEYETQEDVKLVRAVEVIEVHQVKAHVHGGTIGVYTDALGKFEACAGQNCLHTICAITNWGTLTGIQNPSGVTRYIYQPGRDFCPLDSIEPYILDEIGQILLQQQHPQCQNDGWLQMGYLELLDILDARIRQEHMTKPQNQYEVRITLREILDTVMTPPDQNRSVICAIRQSIYQEYVHITEWLDTHPGAGIPPAHEAAVNSIIEQICMLNDKDLETFLNQIFPYSTEGQRLGSCALTHIFFVGSAFFTPFLRTLMFIWNTPFRLDEGVHPHYTSSVNYLLTAIQESNLLKEEVAQKILIHEKLNLARYETKYIITEHYTGLLSEIALKVLPKNRGILAPNALEFITSTIAIQNLN